ncbi:MAG: MBL fold metallo-hydrolase [Nitrososphaerota archaeon]|nr:MBL fold metallo-hydrolase [Candidatus Calditenuaceae archaeon]MDW8073840.1 MBL fold metallo-hydrolase [Nitrososphaerota archaeon]
MRVRGYGGVGEIGGNKFYLEARGEGLFLDFGISYAVRRRYFGWFLRPKRFGLLAYLIATEAAPLVKNLYDDELLDPTGLTHTALARAPELDVHGVVVSHPHTDHLGHVSLLRKDIPIHIGVGSYEIAKARELSKPAKTIEDRIFIDSERPVFLYKTGDRIKVGPFDVRPIHVDHSVPGSYGLIIHTPEGSVAYSGDLRLHGPKSVFTEEFMEAVNLEGVDAVMMEGTRIGEEEQTTEMDVKKSLTTYVAGRRGLVAVLVGILDYDRFSSIASASESAGRTVLVSLRMALMLEVFNRLGVMPRELLPGRGKVEVYLERKGSGLLDTQDYHGWEREYLEKLLDKGLQLMTDLDVASRQGRYTVILNSPDDVLDLLLMRPVEDSLFIYSASEPHNEEQEIDRERIDNWLTLLGMKSVQVHASGHANRGELERILQATRPRKVVPIHTENPELFQSLLNRASPRSTLINLSPKTATII